MNNPIKFKTDSERVSLSSQIHFSPPEMEYLSKIFSECRSGKIPTNPLPIMSNDSRMDPSRVPKDKHLLKFLILSVPYDIKEIISNNEIKDELTTNLEWNQLKDIFSDNIISSIAKNYIPNLRDEILKVTSYSPRDFENKPSTCIKGTLCCGAVLPYQTGSMRPISELSNYKRPSISNLYLCGSGSHPGPGVSMAPGRNAAMIILADLKN